MVLKRLLHEGNGRYMTSVCAAGILLLFPLIAHALDLTERDSGKRISIAAGETISLTLTGNPTTGYTWEVAEIDRSVLAPDPAPSFAADSALTGAGGTFTFRFSALKAGSSAVKLSYRRPWETGVPPLRSVALAVTVLPPEPLIKVAGYCTGDGKRVTASFDLERNVVTVTLPDGRSVTLPAALSASGARYSDGTETFWEHQGKGRFFRGETLLFEGTLQEAGRADSCTR
ncbi:MAG: protease inhibitor I42 family protein [Syntrophales bacterium]